MRNRLYDIGLCVLWLSLGIFVSILSLQLGIGNIRNPGPGLFPFGLGIIFVLLSVFILLEALLSPALKDSRDILATVNFQKVIVVVAVLVAYALSLRFLGYPIAMAAALALLFRIGGYRSWARIMLYAAAIVILTHFMFSSLGVQLPRGSFMF